MREVDRELVRRAVIPGPTSGPRRQLLLVDSRGACAAEAGELIAAGVTGSQVVEIGELVKVSEEGELVRLDVPILDHEEKMGEVEAERDWEVGTGSITMFKSVGVGLQDVAIACAVVDRAEQMGVGTRVGGYD
jgi:ornithine cyclodeaminase/alanine dehydrogenase-like protein (mu-crystallin family)